MAAPRRRAARRTVVLAAAAGTLEEIDETLQRRGVRTVRLETLKAVPIAPRRWRPGLERSSAPDTVVVSSRTAVDAGVRPWLTASGDRGRRAEFWAVGPRTAQALRAVGVRRVHRSSAVSAEGLVRSLARRPGRTILYLRSDRAGASLATSLRRGGHRVVERVVYRLRAAPLGARPTWDTLRQADLLVVTSPSGLRSLRRSLGHARFARVAATVPLAVLGERSERTALGMGFRRVAVVRPTTPQRFTGRLLRELHDARP